MSIKVNFQSFCKNRKIPSPSGAGEELQGGQEAPWRGPPPGRPGHPPGCPGLRLRLHLGLKNSFCCRNFCYVFARIVPALYLVISCVFFLGLFLPRKLSADLGAMASPSSPKDKFIVNVINPYLAEVRKHPQILRVEDGVLHKEDLKGPVKKGSTEERLKEMEHEVFKFKKMVERGVEANFNIMNEIEASHKKEMKEMWSSLAALEEKVYELQAQIYDLQNQSCEYELKFLRMGLGAECRILETGMSFKTGEQLPWKRFAKDYVINRNKNVE